MTNIQKVFAAGYPSLEQGHKLSPEQRSAAFAIMNCKSGFYGFNASQCPDCGYKRIHYNSCRNRNCPSCQSIPKEIWVDNRSAEVIESAYYHVVFTVPSELNPLFYANKTLLYGLLHKCTAETILELAADKKYLGAIPGIIQVLHTWGQTLNYHPHIHAIVTGSGLSKANRIIHGPHKGFFLPVRVMSRKFRGKFMFFLKQLYISGKLIIPASCAHLASDGQWSAFCDALYSKEWCPFIKQTFNGNGNAIEYLGRYAYKIAISNSRILSVEDHAVTFKARDYKTGQTTVHTISCEEFVRRFLMHVLPRGFQKIRYYGFLANRCKKDRLKRIFQLQGFRRFIQKFAGLSKLDIIKVKWKLDLTRCPVCGCQLSRPPDSI